MFKKIKLASLLLLCISVNLSAVDFPDIFGLLLKKGETQYDKPELGRSARYENGPAKLDFYEYDLGLKKIEDGADNKNVENAFLAALDEINAMGAKGLYKQLKQIKTGGVTIPCLTNKKMSFKHARFSYENEQGKKMLTDLLITGYENKFLKLRYTSPAEPDGFHDKVLATMLENLAKRVVYQNQKTDVDEDTKETIFRVVKMLEENPGGNAKIAIPALEKFVEDSPDVLVVFQDTSMGWLQGVPNEEKRLFLGAFLGGNVRAQLEQNLCKDMPYPGVKSVIKTYQQWKKTKGNDPIKVLEELIRLDQEGKLEKIVTSSVKPPQDIIPGTQQDRTPSAPEKK